MIYCYELILYISAHHNLTLSGILSYILANTNCNAFIGYR